MGKIFKGSPLMDLPIVLEVAQLPRVDVAPIRRLAVRLIFILSVLVVAEVGLQLAYPANRALPRTAYADVNLAFSTHASIQRRLDQIAERQITVQAGQHQASSTLAQMGMELDSAKLATELTDYPIRDRLKPFSVFFRSEAVVAQTRVTDSDKLNTFAESIADKANREVKEGAIVWKDAEFAVQQPAAGVRYTSDSLSRSMSMGAEAALKGSISVGYEGVAPRTSMEELNKQAAAAQAILDKQIEVYYGQDNVIIGGSDIGRAVSFQPNQEGKLTMKLDDKKFIHGLEPLADVVFKSPSSTAAGQELNTEKTAEALAAAVVAGQNRVEAVVRTIAPQDDPVYPATSKGIQHMLSDWEAQNSNITVAVDFTEIGNAQRSASIHNSKLLFSASVYKVFAAWRVLTEVDAGRLDPTKPLIGGKNLDECLEEMIVVSASNCAEGITMKYGGWAALNTFVKDKGISNIDLSRGLSISADGMRQFLHKLNAGELMSKTSTNKLLSYMKRQNYRQGIVKGSAGEVADKVGYNPKNPSWHDAALVYHPKTTYSLVILTTSGGQFPMIADLAKQISDTLSR